MSRNKRPVMYKCHGGGRGGGMETGENSVQTGGRTAMQTLVTDRMCSLPLQNVCSSSTECVLFLYRMCSLPLQNVFSSSTECVLFSTECVLFSTECVLFLYRMCARRTHGDADACHWAAPWTPVVEFLYRMCSLLLQNVFSSSTECVLLGRSPGPLLWNSTCYKRCRSEI